MFLISWLFSAIADFSLSNTYNKGKNTIQLLGIIVISCVVFVCLALFLNTLIMVSGKSNTACLALYCSDDIIHYDGQAQRILKAGCCAVSIDGTCYMGTGTQEHCGIPELKGNITIRQCHRALCQNEPGCCARVVANDQCAKSSYNIREGCKIERTKYLYNEGYGPNTYCKYDVECALRLTANPIMSLWYIFS